MNVREHHAFSATRVLSIATESHPSWDHQRTTASGRCIGNRIFFQCFVIAGTGGFQPVVSHRQVNDDQWASLHRQVSSGGPHVLQQAAQR
jgi:hypothetical protein